MKTPLSQVLPRTIHCCAWFAGLVLVWLPLQAGPLTGGAYALVGAPTSGGGNSSGGAYTLAGWVAAVGAGTSTGLGYELTCGLIGGYGIPVGEVKLKVEITDDGRARIWWPAGIAGFQLEFTSILGPGANWQEVLPAPANQNYFVPANQAAQFFRLRKP